MKDNNTYHVRYNEYITRVSPSCFSVTARNLQAMQAAGVRASVDIHPAFWYENEKAACFLYQKGFVVVAAFAVTGTGEMVSLVKQPHETVSFNAIFSVAESYGATWLLAICTPRLLNLYKSHGFYPFRWLLWEDEQAPDNWNYAAHGRPFLAFFMREDFLKASEFTGAPSYQTTLSYADGLRDVVTRLYEKDSLL